jgi:hypothetical protein
MKFPIKTAIAALALGIAMPASAALVEVGSGCDSTLPDPDALACAGAYAGNLNSNSNIDDLNDALDILIGGSGFEPDALWADLDPTKAFFSAGGGTTLDFSDTLFGLQILSIHFGDAGSGLGDHTILYLFDFGEAGADSIVLNQQGWSNTVQIPGPIPEPATWAMMLMGFGAVGYAMRRRRKTTLPQLA